jgi:hypothetical protein
MLRMPAKWAALIGLTPLGLLRGSSVPQQISITTTYVLRAPYPVTHIPSTEYGGEMPFPGNRSKIELCY